MCVIKLTLYAALAMESPYHAVHIIKVYHNMFHEWERWIKVECIEFHFRIFYVTWNCCLLSRTKSLVYDNLAPCKLYICVYIACSPKHYLTQYFMCIISIAHKHSIHQQMFGYCNELPWIINGIRYSRNFVVRFQLYANLDGSSCSCVHIAYLRSRYNLKG